MIQCNITEWIAIHGLQLAIQIVLDVGNHILTNMSPASKRTVKTRRLGLYSIASISPSPNSVESRKIVLVIGNRNGYNNHEHSFVHKGGGL